jgi:hypothetical protein
MKRKRAIILIILLLLVAASVGGQNRVKVEPDQKYLLLSTVKTSTMQKELDEVASQGFRIIVGAQGGSQSEMVLFLERVATPPDTYKYKLLATTKTSTMEKELNQAASEGYRLLARAILAKEGLLSNEVITILELAPRSDKKYNYRLLATSRTSTLQKEVSQAEADGYVLVGLVGRGENMVIMEKESSSAR